MSGRHEGGGDGEGGGGDGGGEGGGGEVGSGDGGGGDGGGDVENGSRPTLSVACQPIEKEKSAQCVLYEINSRN